MFTLETEKYSTIILIHLKGEMCLVDAIDLRSQLENVIKTASPRDIALDLWAVSKVDSSGLGAVVGAGATARSAGKRLMLYRPAPLVVECMETADILGFFPLLEDEEDLLARVAT